MSGPNRLTKMNERKCDLICRLFKSYRKYFYYKKLRPNAPIKLKQTRYGLLLHTLKYEELGLVIFELKVGVPSSISLTDSIKQRR